MATRPLPSEPAPTADDAGGLAPDPGRGGPKSWPKVGSAGTVFIADVSAGPTPPPRAPLRRLFAFGLLAVLVALLALAAAFWLAGRDSGDTETPAQTPTVAPDTIPATTPPPPPAPAPATTRMPDVTGLRLKAAKVSLGETSRTLRLRVRRESSARRPGEVLRQSLAPGTTISLTAVVGLTVSTGLSRIVVPFVEGIGAGRARGELESAGFRPETRLVRSTLRRGTVLEQTPAAGARLEPNSIVLLDVATTPPSSRPEPEPPVASPSPPVISPSPPVTPSSPVAPSPQPRPPAQPSTVSVPALVGSTSSEARSRLRALGLRFVERSIESGRPHGTVVRQSPTAGTRLRKGGTVTLTVSTGPTLIAIPDVIGFDEQTAIEQLETAGFEVRIQEQPTADKAEDGLVLDQSPRDDADALRGSVITIVVARYREGG